jgi:alkylation response protein AidB-like acyl-CoA dehydrogenase
VHDLGRVLLAAESAGGARACLDATVTYVTTREQFGRPIGTFQALQHRCADLAVLVESAEATALCASWVAACDPDELTAVGPLAKVVCCSAYRDASRAMIQLHGGVGFTWEHDAHLHLKRATTTELVLGDMSRCRELVADAVGL